MYPLETHYTDVGHIPYQDCLPRVLRMLHGAILVYNKTEHKIYWSPELLKLLGYSPGEVAVTPEEFIKLQHADDVSLLQYIDQASHLHRFPPLNIRLQKKDGFYRRVELTGIWESEEAGQGDKIILLVKEYVEHRLQRPLVKQEDTLNNEVSRISKVGGWEIDLKTKTHSWTTGMYQILELTRRPSCDELTAMLPEEYKLPVHDAIRHIIKNKLPQSVEYEIYTGSGKRKWLHAKGEPVLDKAGTVVKMIGILQDIDDDRKKAEALDLYYSQLQKTKNLLDEVSQFGKFGLWEASIAAEITFWSKGMYDIHELPYDVKPDTSQLKELYKNTDAYIKLMDCVNACVRNGEPSNEVIFFTGFKGNNRWMWLEGMPVKNEAGEVIAVRGFAQDVTADKQKEQEITNFQQELERNHFILNEAGSMAHIGGWQLNLRESKVSWTKEIFYIHELPLGKVPSFDDSLSFFTPKSRLILKDAIRRTIDYLQPFDLELELVTAKKNKIWVRSIGKPIVNEQGKVMELRGVFQNIMEYKQKEQLLENNNKIIKEQNERLENFAHIVSHNLRSHASTFSASLEAFHMSEDQQEKESIVNGMKKIADNLHETLHHLNEVIKIKTISKEARQLINFEETVQSALEILSPLVKKTNAIIKTDFSACPQVEHIPAYLDSIVLNLLSNALKYCSPDRLPEIVFTTKLEAGKKILMIADNGLGIDLNKYGNKLFGMYKTFHNNPDAKGVGLFITKNQIESLGGTIDVSSKPGTGTVFTVTML